MLGIIGKQDLFGSSGGENLVRIRLSRGGAKKKAIYKVVVADINMPRDGRFIEAIGRYNPRMEPSLVEIDNDKAIKWLARGAQPTNTVEKLLNIAGARQEFEANKEKYLREVSS